MLIIDSATTKISRIGPATHVPAVCIFITCVAVGSGRRKILAVLAPPVCISAAGSGGGCAATRWAAASFHYSRWRARVGPWPRPLAAAAPARRQRPRMDGGRYRAGPAAASRCRLPGLINVLWQVHPVQEVQVDF